MNSLDHVTPVSSGLSDAISSHGSTTLSRSHNTYANMLNETMADSPSRSVSRNPWLLGNHINGSDSPDPDYAPTRSEHSEDVLMRDSPKPRMLLRSNRAKPVTEFALATTDTAFKILLDPVPDESVIMSVLNAFVAEFRADPVISVRPALEAMPALPRPGEKVCFLDLHVI